MGRSVERWRSFFRAATAGLSREAARGLFGELWFIYRWCSDDIADAIGHWSGPLGGRHDFQWPDRSIEVKSAVGGAGAPPVHAISSLDQLADPETGVLYLFSLHAVVDQLAAHTLPRLVQQIRDAIAGAQNTEYEFLNRLSAIGYGPADEDEYDERYRILASKMYRVYAEFPRLTVGSFGGLPPDGIVNISYSIDMAACGQWEVLPGHSHV